MQIIINDKILVVPHYISTEWQQVSSLHMKGSQLAITLKDGSTIQIPNLSSDEISLIFNAHALYLQQESTAPTQNLENINQLIQRGVNEPMVRFAFGGLDEMASSMQHNPAQSNAPDLPHEVLEKIVAITKIIAPEGEIPFEQSIEGCNCFYCQINRAVAPQSTITITPSPQKEEEVVSDEELQFSQWDIAPAGDQLFSVTNKLDNHEKYNVFLGNPVGCTCGKSGCEHILAVLKS